MKRMFLVPFVVFLSVCCGFFAPAEAKTYKMKVHTTGSEIHASSVALKELEKFIEEKSGGKIDVSLHINAALGGDRQAVEAMQLGTLESAIIGGSILGAFEQKFNIFEFPFLFRDDETAKRLLDTELGPILDEALQKQGLAVIAWGVNGFRHTTNNRGPINKPSDMSGLKIRTMENPIHIATFKAFGANPTPMNFSELYTALSQKTVDAMECPINLIYTQKFYEVQKYMSLTGHLYAIAPLIVSDIFMSQLPEDLKAIVFEAGKLYEKKQRELTVTEESEMLQKLKDAGMEVNEISSEAKNEFKELCKPVYQEFEGRVGKELLDWVIKANQ